MKKMIFRMILSFPNSIRMFLALVFICSWQTAFAQVEHLTEDIRVDQEPTSSFSGFPAVAVDSKDNFILAWGDDLFDAGKVLARRFNALGEPLGQEFQVDQSGSTESAVFFNGGSGFADLIDIAVNGSDEFIVVWQDRRTDTFRILARMFDENGAAITDEFRVDQTPQGASPVAPAVAIDSKNNDIIVAWTRMSSSDNLVGVFAKRFNSSGDPISDEFRVDFNSPVGNLDIVTDAFERVIVVWVDEGDDLGEDVFARRFDNNNTFLEPPFQVDIDPSEFSNEPIDASAIAADNNGGFVVVWRESDETLYRRFDSSANPVSPEINVAVSNGVGSSLPDVAIDSQNIITVLYPRRGPVSDPGDLLFAQRYDENDNPIGEEFRVDQGGTIDFNTHLAIAVFSNGSFVSTWHANELTPQESFIGRVFANTVGTPFPKRDLVINEIMYNPNYDDIGTERIELKNVGTDTVSLTNRSLFVTQIVTGDTLSTGWAFPASLKIARGELLVVHWLAEGTDDEGNIFTGLPSTSPNSLDTFTGNNSTVPDLMQLGGPDNQSPFGIGILESNRDVDLTTPSVGFLDGVIFGDLISDPGTLPTFTFSSLIPVGYSLEIATTAADSVMTAPTNFFVQANPTIGFPNSFKAPPPNHLLITEVCVRPRIGEFVEIFNPSDTTLSLSDYFLTDNVNMKEEAYTLLTKGRDSLKVEPGDFFVKFPDAATIGPREFKTIAVNGDDFNRRYRKDAHYEIVDTSSVADMEVVKIGDGIPTFDDPNEVVILLKWNQADTSDLIEDVDYFVWGKYTPPPVIPFIARLADAGENPQAVIPAGPLDEAVNKSGLGIDGMDADFVRSYYGADTPDSLQSPVGDRTHAFLKSWQRRPGSLGVGSVEFGELSAGGNGISGHDETSENLEVAFREETPTPGTGFTEPDNQLDLVIDATEVTEVPAIGLPNGLVNPGEVIDMSISLRNEGPVSTGPLFTVLRSLNPFTTVIDSTANFRSIASGDTAFSEDSFVFSVVRDSLPDSLAFVLRVVQKTSGMQKRQVFQSVKEVFLPFSVPAGNVTYEGTFSPLIRKTASDNDTLLFSFTLTNSEDSRSRAPETIVRIFLTDPNVVQGVSGPTEKRFGNLNIGDSTKEDSFKLVLLPSFSDQASFLELLFSYREGGGRARKFKHKLFFDKPASIAISGKVFYYLDQGGVDVSIDTATVILDCPGFSDTTKTDMSGDYNFEVSFASDKTDVCACTLRVEYSFIPEGAITLEDVDIAKNLALNPSSAVTPFQFIAADVNDEEGVTTCLGGITLDCNTPLDAACVEEDAALIFRKACSPTQTFWSTDWRFINALVTIDASNWIDAPDTLFVNLRQYNVEGLDFTGVLLGDLDGNWLPEAAGSNERQLVTDVQPSSQALPEHFELSQNFPNPFNPTTIIRFQLPVASDVEINVLNMLGQIVDRLIDRHFVAGYHEISWAGTDQHGTPVGSGVYFLQMKAGTFIQHRKMLLIR